MAVRFVIGRAGTGKTHLCLEAIATALNDADAPGRLLFLVPEQASFQMERALVSRVAGGGYWRAEVLSFTRLARRLFAETGAEPVMLRPQARVLALRRIARDIDLPQTVFGRSGATNGFFTQLDRLIEELLTERVTPADLSTAAGSVSDAATQAKVATIAAIYGRYLDWLGEDRLDSALHLQALRERIATVPWLSEASVWVDGFAGFTGQEFATLTALARSVKDMTVTLLMDPSSHCETSDPLALFDRTHRTHRRLLAEMEQVGVEIRDPVLLRPSPVPRFKSASSLAALEQGLATPIGVAGESGGDSNAGCVRLIECGTHRDELHQAARTIRRLIIESGGSLRFRDFAVIARDLRPLAELVVDVFEEYELPFFLDQRRSMSAHPLARMLEALLDAAGDDFSHRSMARLLRTGLTPLSREQAEIIENMIVRLQLQGAKQWGRDVWDPQAELWESLDSKPRCELKPQPLDFARLEVYRALEPLARCAASDSPPTGSEWARGLHDALEALGVRRTIETWIAEAEHERAWESAETHRLAWEAVCGVLENLHEVLDDAPLAMTELRHIVGEALAELTVGLAPPALDQVLVSSIERSRHPEIRYAWVFAFNEGVFPAQPAEDLILSTADRREVAATGLCAPAVHRDDAFGERLLAYIAFTRPTDGLTISYATVDDEGGELAPSPLLSEIRAVLPDLTVERPDEFSSPVTLHEFARGRIALADSDMADRRGLARHDRLAQRLRESGEVAERLDWLLRGRSYTNEPPPLPVDEGSERVWRTSASEIEAYVQCPFRHFAEYHLHLDPQKRMRPLSWDLGSIAHEVLADVFRRAKGESHAVQELSDERWQALLDEALSRFDAAQTEDFETRNLRLSFMIGLLRRFLSEIVTAHAERYRRGGFQPLACELEFGKPRGGLPPLRLTDESGRAVEIRGKIDRIDRCDAERGPAHLIYDYKTKTGTMKLDFLTGHRLQLFVYMLAQRGLPGDGGAAEVAGGLIAPWQPDTGPLETKYFEQANAVEQLMYIYRPRGAFSRSVATILDKSLGSDANSPVAAMRLKQDGEFYSSSDAVTPERIEQTLEVARQTVLQAAAGVGEGRVDVSPLVENKCLACRFCEFRPVCRFDRAFNDPREASRQLPNAGRLGSSA